jgi:hypothetical protein
VNSVDASGREKIRISKDFWIRWDTAKSHVHWGNGNEEMGAVFREGGISHKGRFKGFPSGSEMDALKNKGLSKKAASMAYDSITATMQMNPLFVVGLFLDMAGDFKAADDMYRLGGVL